MAAGWGTLREGGLSFRDIVKLAGKQGLGRLCVYRLAHKPVLIFSTRRSGSTLLMRMVDSQKGVASVRQPLDLWQPHPHFNRLPHLPLNEFITLTDQEEEQLLVYFGDLLSGRARPRGQWDMRDPHFSFRVNRLVVKLLNCKALIDWFATHFDVDIIYQIRHPIPFSLSVSARGWGNAARAYLENERFCSEHLDAELADFGWRVLEHGTLLQRHVLEWCLENIQPLRTFQQRPWLTLTYEEIILRPKEISELICSRLGLPGPDRMRGVVLEATRTTTQHSRRTIEKKGPGALVDKWMREIDPSDAALAGEVLEAFGVRAYDASSAWPDSEFCHFGPLGGE